MARNDAEPIAGTQSLDRALQVLLQIAESAPPGLSLAECSSILGYAKPTTQRMLRTLVARNFLAYNEELGVYALGVANAQLGSEYLNRLDLRRVALPQMRALVAATGETAHLGVVNGEDVIYIEVVDSPHPVRIFSRVGTAVPAYANAIGKAILAWMDSEMLVEHVPEVFVARTSNTVRDRAAFDAEMTRSRARGFATDDEENRVGIRGFAAPIFDHTGVVAAAVSVGGPADRIDVAGDHRLGEAVVEAAENISALMGYRGIRENAEDG